MKTIEHVYESTIEMNGDWQPFTNPEYKDQVTPILEKHAAQLDERIQEALEETNTSFTEVKERYQEQDWSEVANDIWEALNEIDNSPVAQLINNAAYGINEKTVEVMSAIYDKVAERFGETLTTTINEPEAFEKLVDPLIKEAYADLYEEFFEAYDAEMYRDFDPTEQKPPREYYEQHEPEKLEQFDKEVADFISGNEPPPALPVSNTPDNPLAPEGGEAIKDYLNIPPLTNSPSLEAEHGIER